MPDGYGFWIGERYWASLTTGPSKRQHDVYFGPTGADSHGHTWVCMPRSGDATQGIQMKDLGNHLLPVGQTDSFSTQAFLRGTATIHDDGRITTEIAALYRGSAYSAAPVTAAKTTSRREPARVSLDLPQGTKWFAFEVSMVTQESSSHASPSPGAVVSFASGSPLGIRVSVTRTGP